MVSLGTEWSTPGLRCCSRSLISYFIKRHSSTLRHPQIGLLGIRAAHIETKPSKSQSWSGALCLGIVRWEDGEGAVEPDGRHEELGRVGGRLSAHDENA